MSRPEKYQRVSTVSQLIASLQAVEAEHGPNVTVLGEIHGDYLQEHPFLYVRTLNKSSHSEYWHDWDGEVPYEDPDEPKVRREMVVYLAH